MFDVKHSDFNFSFFSLSFIAKMPKEDRKSRRRIMERRQEFMTFPLIVLGVCLYQYFLYGRVARQPLRDEEIIPPSN